NLPEVAELNLAPATIAGIFNGTITRWDAPEIAADNPGTTLPDLAITPVHRSDESGTTENFTEYLAATAGDAWGHEPSGDWPTQGGESAQGTSGVVQTVQGGEGTIGYADASKAGDLGTAKIKVGEEWVAYSPEAAAKVVDASPRVEGRAEHDIAVELDRTTTEAGAYPLVLVSYAIACTSYEDEATGDLVKAFLTYLSSEEGQAASASAAGSAPISEDLRTDVHAAIEAITVGRVGRRAAGGRGGGACGPRRPDPRGMPSDRSTATRSTSDHDKLTDHAGPGPGPGARRRAPRGRAAPSGTDDRPRPQPRVPLDGDRCGGPHPRRARRGRDLPRPARVARAHRGRGRAGRGGRVVPRGRVARVLRRPARLRHAARRGSLARPRDAGRDGHRAVHLALRAAPARVDPRVRRRPARGDPQRRVRAVGVARAPARRRAGVVVARRHVRLAPAVRRAGVADGA